MTDFKAGYCELTDNFCLVDNSPCGNIDHYNTQTELDDAISQARGCGHSVEVVESIHD